MPPESYSDANKNTAQLGVKLSATQTASLQFELALKLQSSLDVHKIIRIFFNEVSPILAINGFSFKNEEHHISCLSGNHSHHRCRYNLNGNGENLGELEFSRSKRFSETDLEFLEQLISLLICPVRNALLYQKALEASLRDPLTGVGNRQALEKDLPREVAIASRHAEPLAILVIDIDNFKSINDQYGHLAGDHAISEIGKLISNSTRKTDITYRYGGEEFVVILNKTDLRGAFTNAERMRKQIENVSFTSKAYTFKLTVSIGIGALTESDSAKELFDRADQALFQAKQQGRNRVVIASPRIATASTPESHTTH